MYFILKSRDSLYELIVFGFTRVAFYSNHIFTIMMIVMNHWSHRTAVVINPVEKGG